MRDSLSEDETGKNLGRTREKPGKSGDNQGKSENIRE